MWIENEVYHNDLNEMMKADIEWKLLKNKNIFVTGGTGLIGSFLINTILYANKFFELNCKVIALVRNEKKAYKVFGEQLKQNLGLQLLEGNVCKPIICETEKIDYVIHAASQTASKGFINESIETIETSLEGTKNTLELAKKHKAEKYIFLSTMEVYGTPHTDEKITEEHAIDLNTLNIRNCYPFSKLMCENLCCCYAEKYNFCSNILRLTQTFGSGVRYDDNRVFAEFARCAIENKDIILHTKGETKRSYLYVSDAIRAIILVMLKNNSNMVYNVANEETYCSILDMAKIVANINGKINVKTILEDNLDQYGYAQTLCMNLDTTKIRKIGWNAEINLEEMYNRLIKFMKIEKNTENYIGNKGE